MKKQLPSVSIIIGMGTLTILFLTVLFNAIAFIFHGHISNIWTFLAFLCSVSIVYYLLHKNEIKWPLIWLGVFVALLVGSVVVESCTLDSTYDGNSYHKTAVGELKNGWNPIYEDVNTFNKSPQNPHRLVDVDGVDRVNDGIWVNSYPKTSWIFGASIYKLTNNIESGKAINILATLMVVFLAFGYLSKRIGLKRSLIVSLLLGFNPVAISQIAGYFNDGAMGNMIISLIILLTIIIDDKKYSIVWRPRIVLALAIFMNLVLVMNMKFTGLAYAAVVMGCYWGYIAIRKNWDLFKLITVVGAISLALGIGIVGLSSYVENYITHHNPLYPLLGQGAVDIMTHNEPASYVHKNNFVKFFEANLSQTSNILYGTGEPHLKIPFTFSVDELSASASSPDVRQAGYGVWFSGIALIAIIAGVYLLVRYKKRLLTNEVWLLILPVVSVALTAILFDGSWWARYLPQLYIVPLIVLIGLYVTHKCNSAAMLLFLMLFNIVLLAALVLNYQVNYTQAFSENLKINLVCNQPHTYVQAQGALSGALYNLWDRCSTVVPVGGSAVNVTDPTKAVRLITDIYLLK